METRTETQATPEGFAQIGIVIHNGREFASGGGYVDDSRIVCYPDKGRAFDWNGKDLGSYRVISSRQAVFFGVRSWQGERYYFARVTLHDGRVYSVRGFGDGMVATGKRCKAFRRSIREPRRFPGRENGENRA